VGGDQGFNPLTHLPCELRSKLLSMKISNKFILSNINLKELGLGQRGWIGVQCRSTNKTK